jgi:hypothetical protein
MQMNNIYKEICEKCCPYCDAECDGCWLEELINKELAEERKKVVQEIRGKGKKENVWNLTNNTSKEVLIIGTDILDQIERGK